MPETDAMLAVTTTGVFRLEPSTTGLQMTLIAGKDFTSTASIAENSTHVWLFANTSGWIYLLRLDTGLMTQWMQVTQPSRSLASA